MPWTRNASAVLNTLPTLCMLRILSKTTTIGIFSDCRNSFTDNRFSSSIPNLRIRKDKPPGAKTLPRFHVTNNLSPAKSPFCRYVAAFLFLFPMAKNSADTPLMQQHRAIKQRYPDAILLFRVGDFYETFGEDAIVASKILGITLTKRNNGAAASSELAGFPHHALDTYLHKLVKAGHRVAVCDQLEDPKMVKGIVKRGVTELVTPGVATNDKLLEGSSNNFLAGVYFPEGWPETGGRTKAGVGLSFLDISTGEFFVAEGDTEYADKLLQTLKPAEIVFQRSFQKHFKEVFGSKFFTYTLESWLFEEGYARENLLKHFQTHSLKGFGVDDLDAGIIAAGAVLHYLKDTEHPHLQHVSSLQRIDREEFLWMDRFTIRNLELMGPAAAGEPGHSLLRVLDHTVSPMGARLLKRWLLMPLKDQDRIQQRLNAVEFLIKDPALRTTLAQHIAECG